MISGLTPENGTLILNFLSYFYNGPGGRGRLKVKMQKEKLMQEKLALTIPVLMTVECGSGGWWGWL